MADSKKLIADAAIGTSVTDCFVLAVHPDERKGPDGRKLSTTRRTFLLKFDGKEAAISTTIPAPLVRAWSSRSGQAYCTPLLGNYLYIYSKGDWRREQFSSTDEQIVFIWGISGSNEDEDIVFLSTYGGLFVRTEGKWTRHAPPLPAKRVYGTHGVSPDQVYVCSDQDLLIWNGKSFKQIEGPNDDVPKAIWVTAERVLAGNDYLNQWTREGGWRHATEQVKDITALYEFQGRMYVGTYKKGVLQLSDGSVEQQTPDFFCLALQGVGNGVLAIGDKYCQVCINGSWQQVNLPDAP